MDRQGKVHVYLKAMFFVSEELSGQDGQVGKEGTCLLKCRVFLD